MEMILLISCWILFAIGLLAIALGAATRKEPTQVSVPLPAPQPSRFFKAPAASSQPTLTPLPVEALLLQIENHIRLEKAAAESFVAMPTAKILHCKTKSPLAH